MSLIDSHFNHGARETLGTYLFSEDEILAFARRYDPQRFHIDANAARETVFGGLCASGWHTTAVWMKMNVAHMPAMQRRWQEQGLTPPEFGPSPGIRKLRWLRPVFAGESIAFFSTAVSERPLASRPGWHLLDNIGEAETAEGTPVLRFESSVMMRP